MADSNEAPQTGGGEGPAAVISPPQVAEAEKPVDTQTKQQNDEPTAQNAQQETKPITEVVAPAAAGDGNEETTVVAENNSKKEETITPEVKEEIKVLEEKPVEATVDGNANNVEQNSTAPKEVDWQQREAELLKKIDELEKIKNEKSEDALKLQLKVREEEIDLLKARVKNLETELHAALSKPGGKNHEMIEHIKQQHEELLSKAKGMIFDKTKMVKNQELQIEALTTQVQSLKDINLITKDLLEIRNSEVKAMEDRLQTMEARFKTEKERYGLVLERAQTSSNINDDLKKEYVTQLAIFKELREKYEQRVNALVAENEKLKESIKTGATPNAATSSST